MCITIAVQNTYLCMCLTCCIHSASSFSEVPEITIHLQDTVKSTSEGSAIILLLGVKIFRKGKKVARSPP